MSRILLKLKLRFMMLGFEKHYLMYIGYQIGKNERLQEKRLSFSNLYELLYNCNRYLAMGILSGYYDLNTKKELRLIIKKFRYFFENTDIEVTDGMFNSIEKEVLEELKNENL